jgi:exopolysaccharide biosynthesis WecB/TagA/CpsF family protein
MDAAQHSRHHVVACHAVHAIVTSSGDPALCEQVNQFDMVTPDGQPVRWALNILHGAKLADRVYGPELTLRVCRAAAEQSVPIYLYGGSPEVLELLHHKLLEQIPDLIIAGEESPPYRELSPQEEQAACDRINSSGAKIVLIGLGCPKQDWFAARNRDRIDGVQLCVGAAFDFHAGVKPIAPAWMQRRGLEWLFRLWCEPRRLWRRYLVTNAVFSAKLLLAVIRKPFRRK